MSFASPPNSQTASSSKKTSKGPLPTHCNCNLPLAKHVSHTGANPGREFLRCVDKPYKAMQKGCTVFYWIDEYDPPSSQRVSSQASSGTVTTASPPSSQLKAWTGNPPIKTSPIKRKRSESPAPTQPSSVHSGSWVAGPPTTYSSSAPSRPLYPSSPRPSKRAKANPTSEDELWGDEKLSEESLATFSQVLVPEKKAETSASGSKTNYSRPLNLGVTPKRNTEVSNGLATPVSGTKPPGPRFSLQKAYNATDETPRWTARDLGKGPILDEDPDNPFVTNETRRGTAPEPSVRTIAKQPSIPETPRTPSGLLRSDSATSIPELKEAVVKVESEISLKERQINAGRKEIEYKANRMKRLEAERSKLREQVEALTRENARLHALLGDEGLDEYH